MGRAKIFLEKKIKIKALLKAKFSQRYIGRRFVFQKHAFEMRQRN